MKIFATLLTIGGLIAFSLAPATASDSTHGSSHGSSGHGSSGHGSSGHGTMSHGEMKAPENVNEAEAKGKINTIDAEGGMVNLTHEPVESLGWPKMTMDLPVTRRVDLTTVKPGTDVTFKLKKGRDNKFRIIEISPSE